MIRYLASALLCLAPCLMAADVETRSRQVLLTPVNAPHLSPIRKFCEVDLNGDGIDELILSRSVSLGGTGGLVYDLYLGLEGDRFKPLDSFLSCVMAVEPRGKVKRLWTYTHSSSQSGHLQYRYFDRDGDLQKGPAMLIHPGDGGSETGNAIFDAVFRHDNTLKMKTIGNPKRAVAPDRKSAPLLPGR